MRIDPRLAEFRVDDQADRPERRGAQIIDIRTGAELLQATRRKSRPESLSLLVGIALLTFVGALTLWSFDKVGQPDNIHTGTRPPRVGAPPVRGEAAAHPGSPQVRLPAHHKTLQS